MRGITIGGYHTYDDWGLMLRANPIIGAPQPKVELLEIPGANGFLDLSSVLTGEPVFSGRKCRFDFVTDKRRDGWQALYWQVVNAVAGESLTLELDEDPGYFYTGVFSVGDLTDDKDFAYFSITGTLDPFKYARDLTILTADASVIRDVEVQTPGNRYLPSPTRTVYTFGTPDAPSFDFSKYKAITVTWDKSYADSSNVQIEILAKSSVTAYTVPASIGRSKIQVSALGVDPSKIYRINISAGVAELTVTATTGSLVCPGCKKSVAVTVACKALTTVTMLGQSTTIRAGGSRELSVLLPPGGATMELAPDVSAADNTVTVTYRKAWL